MIVELHLIQNFSPSCLNRDDANAPKSCEFGGYPRARISSQCLKRAIRKYFADKSNELFLETDLAVRSKLLIERLVTLLGNSGKDSTMARKIVTFVIEDQLIVKDSKTSTILFLGSDEINRLHDAFLSLWDKLVAIKGSIDEPTSAIINKKTLQSERTRLISNIFDVFKRGTKAVDIALFGRMIAELPDLNMHVNAACQVAHAISTNKSTMELDFYTAAEDLQCLGGSGTAMMGIVEYNSSCFYRYSLLDVGQLNVNLQRDNALTTLSAIAYVKASVFAIPAGKQNSMAAHNLPSYIRAIVRDRGSPRSLANAFLTPVQSIGGDNLVVESIRKLEGYNNSLCNMYGRGGIKLDETLSEYDNTGSEGLNGLINKLETTLQ